ncbi:hypothetical protein BD770DRAFT_412892 [Pilaira anomala]|nr:hypothetical protein BD770DRAFT_412892 [Pilaira anomala]
MSQERLTPEREHSNEKVNLSNISPFRLLSMLSRLTPEEPKFNDIVTEETKPKPYQPFGFQPIHENYAAEFNKKYKSIPFIDFRKDEEKDSNLRKFWERKRRHKEIDDNASFTANSDTNYSRLDYIPVGTNMDIDDDDDDEVKSFRTQDMLNEEEYNNVVLDNEKMMELKKKIDEEFVRESLFSNNQALQNQVPQSQKLESKELPSQPFLDQAIKDEAIKTQPLQDEYQLPVLKSQGLEMTIYSPQALDDNEMDTRAMKEKMDNFNEGVDWGDDGQGFSDNESQVEVEGDTSANQFSSELQLAGEEINVELARHLGYLGPSKLFKNKMAVDVKVTVADKTIRQASDKFFSQLIRQMKAYKNKSTTDQSSFTDHDMISFMKRQRIISEKTTVEQLACKYLSRELYDEICVSAQDQNILYPQLSAKAQEQYDAYY